MLGPRIALRDRLRTGGAARRPHALRFRRSSCPAACFPSATAGIAFDSWKPNLLLPLRPTAPLSERRARAFASVLRDEAQERSIAHYCDHAPASFSRAPRRTIPASRPRTPAGQCRAWSMPGISCTWMKQRRPKTLLCGAVRNGAAIRFADDLVRFYSLWRQPSASASRSRLTVSAIFPILFALPAAAS